MWLDEHYMPERISVVILNYALEFALVMAWIDRCKLLLATYLRVSKLIFDLSFAFFKLACFFCKIIVFCKCF